MKIIKRSIVAAFSIALLTPLTNSYAQEVTTLNFQTHHSSSSLQGGALNRFAEFGNRIERHLASDKTESTSNSHFNKPIKQLPQDSLAS